MRESYRLNKLDLLEKTNSKNYNIRILFSLTQFAYDDYKNLKFNMLSENMLNLLSKINNSLP
ncbi:MAG: hypothetical protein L0Y79_11430 [Chlorobi bacterium]|nr:hypothetical protein [Chlorobiota bacterium]MCI0716766.1 hypothetical protein [Chlorobiota bacterium]